jgi:hypothetical protein
MLPVPFRFQRRRPLRRGDRRSRRARHRAARIPIGVGKPVALVNALYRLAEA